MAKRHLFGGKGFCFREEIADSLVSDGLGNNLSMKPEISLQSKRQKVRRQRLMMVVFAGLTLFILLPMVLVPSWRSSGLVAKGDCEMILGLKSRALTDFATAVTACPDNQLALERTSFLLSQQNRQNEALAYLHKLDLLPAKLRELPHQNSWHGFTTSVRNTARLSNTAKNG